MNTYALAGVVLATLTISLVSSRKRYLLVEVPDQPSVDEPVELYSISEDDVDNQEKITESVKRHI